MKKTIGSSDILLTILMLSLPLNFIMVETGGNLYLSSIVVIFQFCAVLFLSNGKLLFDSYALLCLLLLVVTSLATLLNVIFNENLVEAQLAKTIIYVQNYMGFSLMIYYLKYVSIDFFLRLFIYITLFAIIRVIIEEPNNVFKLSVIRGERIESLFVAGVNTFAIFIGLSFVISFFHFKKGLLRNFLVLLFFFMIILTMSRGALIAAIFTLLITSLYDPNRDTFNKFVKYGSYCMGAGIIVLFLSGKMEQIWDLFHVRFLSILDGNTSLDTFFAGRFTLIEYTFNKLSESSVSQILFGHGSGSIDFTIPATGQNFKTTHLVVFDILYRNGVILMLLFILLQVYILYKFIKLRRREKIVLFGLFVFFHLELLVNPMIFSAQSGWVYFLFLAVFIKQDSLTYQKQNEQLIE